MITDVLLEYRALVPAALLLTAVLCVAIGYLLQRNEQHGKRASWALVALSMLALLTLALVPSGRDPQGDLLCVVQFSFPTLGSIELLANVAVFVPLAYFATLATQRPVITLAASSALSVTIEAGQALVPALGRACDTNDWLMNTIGALAGVLLACLTIAIARRSGAGKAVPEERHTRARREKP